MITKNKSNFYDFILEKFFLCVGLVCLFALFLIMLFLFKEGLPILAEININEFLFGTDWYPTSEIPRFGIFTLIIASVSVTLLASLIAVPLSIAIAVYLSELSNSVTREIVKPAIEIIASLPSVVIGFFGMSILSSSNTSSQKRDVEPPIRAVNTEIIEFRDLDLEITGNGIVESRSILDVVSEVSGMIEYAKNNIKNGTYVEKGEVVVKVDSREIENNLFSLRSDFINAIALLLPDLKVESEQLYSKWSDYFSSIDIHRNIPPLPEISNVQEKIKLSSRQIFSKYYAARNQ